VLKLPVALQRNLLRAVIEKLAGNLMDIEARHIEQLIAALHKPAGKIICLPSDLVFVTEYDRYLLGSDPAALLPFPPLDREFPLRIPGETKGSGWRIQSSVIGREETAVKDGDCFTAFLDFDRTGDELFIGRLQPGDRFQPLGMSQIKKVGKFMIDARIPHAWRERIPIVRMPGQIVWIVGYRIDNRVRVTESTGRVLRLEFQKEGTG